MQLSLKEKIERYMSTVLARIDVIKISFIFGNEHDIDQDYLIYRANKFLATCTPTRILYGGYITRENDVVIV